MSVLRDVKVREEVILLDSQGMSSRDIAAMVGSSKSSIGDMLRGETYGAWLADYKRGMGSVEGVTEEEECFDTVPKGLDAKRTLRIDVEPVRIVTSKKVAPNCTHAFIGDLQVKPNINMSYLSWIGSYLAAKKPEVIINIGDHFDLPSLSSYDKGTKGAEGKRLSEDIEAGIVGMNLLLRPIADVQAQELEEFGEVRYKPKMVFTVGNHEERLMRHINFNPELAGLVSYDDFKLKENGWEVYDFLEPAMVHGVTYIHYQPNPMTGKPYGGSAANILGKVGESFCMGHKQTLDAATRFLPCSGRQQWGIILGAGYPHDEGYKGYTGNKHFRGMAMLHQVKNGSFNPSFIDLEYLEKRYAEIVL